MRLAARLQLAALLVVACASRPAPGHRSKCSAARDQQMDVCASRLGFLGDHSFRVPKNLTQMDAFCANLKESIGCIQSYSRECLSGFTKQILTSLLKRGKQQHASICASEASRRDLMRKLACLTDDKIEQFHACMDASIARYEFIRAQLKAENRLPGLCCSYSLFNQDIDETLARICPQPARNPAARAADLGETNQFIHKVASGTAGEFFALVCDNHRTYDECKASPHTKEALKQLEAVSRQVRAGKLKPKSRSLIPPLLDVLDGSGGAAGAP